MSYFTNSRYERMMNRVPKPVRENRKPVLPKYHPCYGCKRYGEGCFHPCYRDVQRNPSLEVLLCGL